MRLRDSVTRVMVIGVAVVWASPGWATDIVQSSAPGSAILDYQTVTDTMTIADALTIQDIRVGVDIAHTFQSDLDIDVTSPAGTTVKLMQNAGAGADDVLVTFASSGMAFDPLQLTAGLGYWMQALGPGAMSDFHGEDSVGEWTFEVFDDFGGDTGTLNEWSLFLSDAPPPAPSPANDTCADAIVVTEPSVTPFITPSATASGIASGCAGAGSPVDVWYRFEVVCDSDVTFATCGSSFDTTLAVWDGTSGCPLPGDAALDCLNDSCGLNAELTIPAVAGQTLYVQVAGFSGATGDGTLTVTSTAAPINDDCVSAIPVFAGTTPFSTICATTDGIAPGCGGFATPLDIWYTYTATCDGDVTVDTFGSAFDTRLAIWVGTSCPVPGVSPLYCNDNSGGPQTEIVIQSASIGDEFLIQVGGSSIATGLGVLNVGCDLPAAPPVNSLDCDPSLGQIIATWNNPQVFDEILIYVDGSLVSALPGSATSALIDGLNEYTTYDVCIETVLSGYSPEQTCCTATTPGDATGLHMIFYGEGISGLVDSVAALETALNAHGIDPVIVGPASMSSITVPPAVLWVILGTYPANHPMSPLDGETLVALQAAGTAIYASGGDTFGFDPQTAFAAIDGVHPDALDGDDTHEGMIGGDFLTGFDATYTQDQGTSLDWIDQIAPANGGEDDVGSDSRVLLTDDGSGGSTIVYNTGIAYYPTSGGRVCSVSTEFGGYDGDQIELAAALLEFLLDSPVATIDQFRRGDVNGDTTFDISDAVFTLAALFIPASPAPECTDATDSNDDGVVDISDAVYSLAALFIPGSPSLPAPTGACGTDPTPDALDCIVSGCP